MKLRGKKATEILGQTVLWVILIASLLIFSVPFFFMITNSFEEFSYVLPYPPMLFPTRLDFSAYRHILSMDIFPTALANSVINTVITVVISVFVSTLSAYGFACIRFPGRDKLFAVYLFTLMMPGFLNIIPQFLVLKQLTLPGLPNGLIGTRAGLILSYVATNVCGHTFFLRNFFRSLPSSLAESVLLDGGGDGREGVGAGLGGGRGQDAEAGLPAAGLGGAGAAGRAGHGVRTAHAAGIAVAFAAAGQQQCRRHGTAQKSFLSLCHKRYAPFHLFGNSIARQESIYLCIFLLETVLYLSCGLPRPVLWEGRCCPMAYISTFILSVGANVASYYICKWLDGWLKGRKH